MSRRQLAWLLRWLRIRRDMERQYEANAITAAGDLRHGIKADTLHETTTALWRAFREEVPPK